MKKIFLIILIITFFFNAKILNAFPEEKFKHVEFIFENIKPIEVVELELLPSYNFSGQEVRSFYLESNDFIFDITDKNIVEVERGSVIGIPGEPPKMREYYPEMITLKPAFSWTI